MRTGKNTILYNSLIACFFIGMTAMISCNSGDDKSGTTSDSTKMSAAGDTSAMNKDTTAKMAKKIRKGRAVVASITKGMNMMGKDKEGVYSNPETMPEYPGGQTALATYVENNVNYPQQAVDNNIEGTVKVSFIVDEHGKVMNPKVEGSKVGNGLDEEAIKVVGQMPPWTPGKVKGKNVKTRLELPISFQVSES